MEKSATEEKSHVKRLSKKFEIEYQWHYINFTWPSRSSYQNAVSKKSYIPENISMNGIKVYKNRLYIALPQIEKGVPVTLGTISLETSHKLNPLIEPFPTWNMNVKRDCSTLQSVYSMEIDKDGIMWALDGFRTNNHTKCPPKLILLDLNHHGVTVLSHIFPKEIASSQGGLLSDLVVDHSDGDFAYITDNSPVDPGLIVYSRKQNRSWKLRDGSMFPEKDAMGFTVNGLTFSHLSPIKSIALSPPHGKSMNKLLFYCSLTGVNLFAIKTNVLKNEYFAKTGEWRKGLKLVGRKQGQSGGLMMDNVGNLYYTLLPLHGLAKWNINQPFSTSKIIVQDKKDMVWMNSLAFDDKGNLRILSGNFHKFIDNSVNLRTKNETQFRVLRFKTGTRSYLVY